MASNLRQRKGAATSAASQSAAADADDKKKAASAGEADVEWRLFSPNPEKAWVEKFYILYSPVWAGLFGAWCFSGVHLHAGDIGNVIACIVLALPDIIVPWLFCPTDQPFYKTYWFKFSVWIFIFAFEASYFFTEYFFDVLGMKYAFPHLEWNLDSKHVGSGRQVVPVMMYLHAWYFFITYHACSVVFIRAIRTAPVVRDSGLAQAVAVFASSMLFAWGEIKATTMEAIQDLFNYKNMDWALTWGALCYACYFIPSFPMVYGLDESPDPAKRWSLRRTIESGFAAAMVAFTLLDLVVQFVITDWHDKA